MTDTRDEAFKWAQDYGKDLLTDLNALAHANGTDAIRRDAFQRAYKEIHRLSRQLAEAQAKEQRLLAGNFTLSFQVQEAERKLAEAQEVIEHNMTDKPHGEILDEMDHQAKYQSATINTRLDQEMRIQALGAVAQRVLNLSRELPQRPSSPYGGLRIDETAIYEVARQAYETIATLSRKLAETQAELNMWRASFPGSAEAVKRDALEKLK